MTSQRLSKAFSQPVSNQIFGYNSTRTLGEIEFPELLLKGEGDTTTGHMTISPVPESSFFAAPAVQISTTALGTVALHPDSKVFTTAGTKAARDVKVGDHILSFLCEKPEDTDPFAATTLGTALTENFRGQLLGLLMGDGTLRVYQGTKKKKTGESSTLSQYVLYFCHPIDTPPPPEAVALAVTLGVAHRTYQKMKSLVTTLAIPKKLFPEMSFTHKRQIEDFLRLQSQSFVQGFLQGFLACDASCKGSKDIRLSQSDLPRLQLSKILLARFGIFSRIFVQSTADTYTWWEKQLDEEGRPILLENGKPFKKAVRQGKAKKSYYLKICGLKDMKLFQERVGFSAHCCAEKEDQLEEILQSRKVFTQIPAIEEVEAVEILNLPYRTFSIETEPGVKPIIGLNGYRVCLE